MQAQNTLVNLNQSYSQWTAEEARFNAELDRRMYAKFYRDEGISQGAHDARVETARALLSFGDGIEKIAQATGLPLAEVEQLAETISNE